MSKGLLKFLASQHAQIQEQGLFKAERVIHSPQSGEITLESGQHVINLCANNYLGLADNAGLINSAKKALDAYGYGMASVRFICGTQTPHIQLEKKVSAFLGTEDTILYSSCFDANGGLFETILGEEDAVISDALNHASIIDGIRLCKAKRFRYANNDMADLEVQLKAATEQNARFKLIATDGVFSMDGTTANLSAICELAERYDALVMVDDSHATGFVGPNGKGTPELYGVQDKIDILTSTLGKALGGAAGGFTSGRKEIIAYLRQRSRPYLFSNSLMPVIAATANHTLDLIDQEPQRRQQLQENSEYFRAQMASKGFNLVPGSHPIIPIMIGDAALSTRFANALLKEGVYVIGFNYPVVPMGKARIRTQMSASHTREELDNAIAAFTKVGKELGII